MELAIPHPTTKSFFTYNDVVDLQLKKTTAFHELEVDRTYAAVQLGPAAHSD